MIVNGTTYKDDTPKEVVEILEKWRVNGRDISRIRVHYGDVQTGRPWGDTETGYIGRSMGPVKIPLMIHNKRSLGGPGLLEHCIIMIEYANKKHGGVLYRNPKYVA